MVRELRTGCGARPQEVRTRELLLGEVRARALGQSFHIATFSQYCLRFECVRMRLSQPYPLLSPQTNVSQPWNGKVVVPQQEDINQLFMIEWRVAKV